MSRARNRFEERLRWVFDGVPMFPAMSEIAFFAGPTALRRPRLARLGAVLLITGLALPATAAGDAERGRALLLQRHETGCILCHVVPGLPLGGAIGPPLVDLAKRLDADGLRARIADARRFNPDTVMPPSRSTAGLYNVASPFAGRSLLTEQALDDIVAYLLRPAPAHDARPHARPHAAR